MSGIISDIGNQISNAVGNITPSNLFSMFFHIGQSKIGYLTLDVLVTENLDLPSEVTKYPVEDGDEDVTDHITAGNEELTISGAVAAGSALGIEFGLLCYSKLIDAVDQLRKMHKERKTFTVITGLGKYEEMAFTKLTIERTSSGVGGQWITINATLRKIRKVTLKQADMPPDQVSGDGDGSGNAKGKSGRTESKTGPAEQSFDPSKKTLGKYIGETKAPWAVGPIKYVPKLPSIPKMLELR